MAVSINWGSFLGCSSLSPTIRGIVGPLTVETPISGVHVRRLLDSFTRDKEFVLGLFASLCWVGEPGRPHMI